MITLSCCKKISVVPVLNLLDTTPWRLVGMLRYNSAVRGGGDWPASALATSCPGKEPPGTHGIGGWVGHRDSLDAVG
jgi:hypothetical protein